MDVADEALMDETNTTLKVEQIKAAGEMKTATR